jgi:hypothetical protein
VTLVTATRGSSNAGLESVTVTPGITAPDESVTFPNTWLVFCASTVPLSAIKTAKKRPRRFFITAPEKTAVRPLRRRH